VAQERQNTKTQNQSTEIEPGNNQALDRKTTTQSQGNTVTLFVSTVKNFVTQCYPSFLLAPVTPCYLLKREEQKKSDKKCHTVLPLDGVSLRAGKKKKNLTSRNRYHREGKAKNGNTVLPFGTLLAFFYLQ
jgi:hypothetical protein